jgi:hypothetical protein
MIEERRKKLENAINEQFKKAGLNTKIIIKDVDIKAGVLIYITNPFRVPKAEHNKVNKIINKVNASIKSEILRHQLEELELDKEWNKILTV